MCRINVSGSAIQALEVSLCVIQFSEKPITLFVWFLFSRGEMHPKREDIFHNKWHIIFLESWNFVFTLRLSAWFRGNENKSVWMGGCVNQTYFQLNLCTFELIPIILLSIGVNERKICVIAWLGTHWALRGLFISGFCTICYWNNTKQ